MNVSKNGVIDPPREQANPGVETFHYTRADWTSFRSLTGLCQKAGCGEDDLAKVVIKELADNALDAAGDCEVEWRDGTVIVRNPGGGIPGEDEAIADLFSVARPLTSSKYERRPSRGALGNGIRVVVGAVMATGGELTVATRGRRLRVVPDHLTGRSRAERVGPYDGHGTEVAVRLGAPLALTPADLELAEIAGIAAAATERKYAGRSSPHWYNAEAFHELCLSAPPHVSAREQVARLDGCTGPKAGAIAAEFKGRPARSLTRGEAACLLSAARGLAREVQPDRLGKTAADAFPGAYVRQASFAVFPRGGDHFELRIPVVVEVWAEPYEGAAAAIFLVNGTPCVTEGDAWHSVKEKHTHFYGDGLNFKVKSRVGAFYHVNLITPHMPIKSDGKAPVLGCYGEHVRIVIEKATRRIQARAAPGLSSDEASTVKGVVFAHMEEAIRAVSGGRRHRFGWRQVFYRVRPIVRDKLGRPLEWNYFSQTVVTEWEEARGEDPLAYRDPRGTFYHPHLREEIPLGTIAVEQYRRPEWFFNKILYIEKEGFFHALRADGWPERNDCALVTSKGQPTRAARDILDLIGATGEPVQFFCTHDADAAGTLIYQTLQEETRARPRRNVEIVNLGLDPWEAAELAAAGVVEIEDCEYEKEQPAARYVPPEWREWLQRHRVELNAFTTPQFIERLDAKIAPYVGKVLPPPGVQEDHFRARVEERVYDEIKRRVLAEARLDDRVRDALDDLEPAIEAAVASLAETVAGVLSRERHRHWGDVVGSLAELTAAAAERCSSAWRARSAPPGNEGGGTT